MIFETLLNVANRAIKDLSFARPAHPASSEPKLWISPLMHARAQSQSSSTDTSSNSSPTSSPLIFTPNSVEKGVLEKVNTKKSGRSRRSAFNNGKIYTLQPKVTGATSESEDSYKPVPLHHPHPKQISPDYKRQDMWSFRDNPIDPPQDEDTPPSSPSPSPSPSNGNRPPSLVPTIVVTRSPSPQPHPCVDQARALGIKVRDFAHEDHGVALAPPVPDIDQLKISYYLYRSAGLTPPSETMENLQIYDPEWFNDTERRFEIQPSPKLHSRFPVRTWVHETKRGGGVQKEDPDPAPPAEGDLLVDKITSWLDTISLDKVSQNEDTHR